MTRLGIVADDLTGAMDSGVQLAKGGLHTVVMLGEAEPPLAEAVVISTDSRDVAADVAYERARGAAHRLVGRLVYKKIDSTLRGNLGAELDGLLDGLHLERALVVPAFPDTGRTTVNGYHRVDGVLISESSFARDPLWPATESHIPTLLRRQTNRCVGHLPMATIERGEAAVMEALAGETASVVVGDTATTAHLRCLARAVTRMEGWLPCGSAGLAGEWPRALGLERETGRGFGWLSDPRPVLVVAGSRHPSTARQLERAVHGEGLELVRLPEEGCWTAESVARATSSLSQGRSIALTTAFSPYMEGQGASTAAELAAVVGEVMAMVPVAGLFLTGGDIARAVCRALGARALRALGEVQAGVPAGLLVGGPYDGVRVVTKAGGFGNEMAISQSIDCLQGR